MEIPRWIFGGKSGQSIVMKHPTYKEGKLDPDAKEILELCFSTEAVKAYSRVPF